MGDLYDWVKAAHILSVIAWMAGMLYLPRLFVYHAGVAPGGEASELFKVMERRLMRGIINPAMTAAWIFGGTLAYLGHWYLDGWFHAKLALVLILSGMHGFLSRWRRAFERDENRHTARFFRFMNEIPTLLMVGIVLLVVLKP